jgi:alpha/beta superfamily hydrolase
VNVGAANETPVYFRAGGHDLFGIVTEPAGTPRGVGAVILSGGGRQGAAGIPNPGRNDVSVHLARRLAAEGLHALRMDYRGVGESGGETERFLLADPFPEDVKGAVACLGAFGVEQVVLLGACFGGRAALAAAPDLPGVRGVALFGSPVRDFERGERLASRPLSWHVRKALTPAALKGLLDAEKRAAYLALARRKARQLRRGPGPAAAAPSRGVSPKLVAQLSHLVDRGVPVLFVYGPEDDFHDDFQRGLDGPLGDVVARAGGVVAVEVVPGKVHGLASVGVQEAVMATSEKWVSDLVADIPLPTAHRAPASADGLVRAHRVDGRRRTRDEARFVGPTDSRLFLVEHVPEGAPARGGVVICPPICADFVRNYRREVLLGRELAARGIAVARFHYRGTGNSDGDASELTFDGMRDDALAARAELASRHGVGDVALVGTRFGALVAAAAAALAPAPTVLVEPVPSAARFLREGSRAGLAHQANVGGPAAKTSAQLLAELDETGVVEVLGHSVGRSLFRTASERTLERELVSVTAPVLVLQLGAGDAPSAELERVVAGLRGRGVEAELRQAGQRMTWWFLDEPESPGESLVGAVADWIEERVRG